MASKKSKSKGQLHKTAEKIKKGKFPLPKGFKNPHMGHADTFTNTRTAEHNGRKISIQTTYKIEIDGQPVTVHTMVMDDGSVHCHGLPNYTFSSAIDLARALIDTEALSFVEKNEIKSHKGEA